NGIESRRTKSNTHECAGPASVFSRQKLRTDSDRIALPGVRHPKAQLRFVRGAQQRLPSASELCPRVSLAGKRRELSAATPQARGCLPRLRAQPGQTREPALRRRAMCRASRLIGARIKAVPDGANGSRVLVAAIEPGGPADKAGLKKND